MLLRIRMPCCHVAQNPHAMLPCCSESACHVANFQVRMNTGGRQNNPPCESEATFLLCNFINIETGGIRQRFSWPWTVYSNSKLWRNGEGSENQMNRSESHCGMVRVPHWLLVACTWLHSVYSTFALHCSLYSCALLCSLICLLACLLPSSRLGEIVEPIVYSRQ